MPKNRGWWEEGGDRCGRRETVPIYQACNSSEAISPVLC